MVWWHSNKNNQGKVGASWARDERDGNGKEKNKAKEGEEKVLKSKQKKVGKGESRRETRLRRYRIK